MGLLGSRKARVVSAIPHRHCLLHTPQTLATARIEVDKYVRQKKCLDAQARDQRLSAMVALAPGGTARLNVALACAPHMSYPRLWETLTGWLNDPNTVNDAAAETYADAMDAQTTCTVSRLVTEHGGSKQAVAVVRALETLALPAVTSPDAPDTMATCAELAHTLAAWTPTPVEQALADYAKQELRRQLEYFGVKDSTKPLARLARDCVKLQALLHDCPDLRQSVPACLVAWRPDAAAIALIEAVNSAPYGLNALWGPAWSTPNQAHASEADALGKAELRADLLVCAAAGPQPGQLAKHIWFASVTRLHVDIVLLAALAPAPDESTRRRIRDATFLMLSQMAHARLDPQHIATFLLQLPEPEGAPASLRAAVVRFWLALLPAGGTDNEELMQQCAGIARKWLPTIGHTAPDSMRACAAWNPPAGRAAVLQAWATKPHADARDKLAYLARATGPAWDPNPNDAGCLAQVEAPYLLQHLGYVTPDDAGRWTALLELFAARFAVAPQAALLALRAATIETSIAWLTALGEQTPACQRALAALAEDAERAQDATDLYKTIAWAQRVQSGWAAVSGAWSAETRPALEALVRALDPTLVNALDLAYGLLLEQSRTELVWKNLWELQLAVACLPYMFQSPGISSLLAWQPDIDGLERLQALADRSAGPSRPLAAVESSDALLLSRHEDGRLPGVTQTRALLSPTLLPTLARLYGPDVDGCAGTLLARGCAQHGDKKPEVDHVVDFLGLTFTWRAGTPWRKALRQAVASAEEVMCTADAELRVHALAKIAHMPVPMDALLAWVQAMAFVSGPSRGRIEVCLSSMAAHPLDNPGCTLTGLFLRVDSEARAAVAVLARCLSLPVSGPFSLPLTDSQGGMLHDPVVDNNGTCRNREQASDVDDVMMQTLVHAWRASVGEDPGRLLAGIARCPITEAPLRDPVRAPDGRTYERAAYAAWVQAFGVHPPHIHQTGSKKPCLDPPLHAPLARLLERFPTAPSLGGKTAALRLREASAALSERGSALLQEVQEALDEGLVSRQRRDALATAMHRLSMFPAVAAAYVWQEVDTARHVCKRLDRARIEMTLDVSKIGTTRLQALGLRPDSKVSVTLDFQDVHRWQGPRFQVTHDHSIRGFGPVGQHRWLSITEGSQAGADTRLATELTRVTARSLRTLFAGGRPRRLMDTLHATLQGTLMHVGESCIACGTAHGVRLLRPEVCSRQACRSTVSSLSNAGALSFHTLHGGGNGLPLVAAHVAGALGANELVPDAPFGAALTSAHIDGYMRKKSSDTATPEELRALGWAMSTAVPYVVPTPATLLLAGASAWAQYMVCPSNPAAETAFRAQRNTHGSDMYFHGTAYARLHRILREGLQVMSGTSMQANGAALGSGVYLSSSCGLSRDYATNNLSNDARKQVAAARSWSNVNPGAKCFLICEVIRGAAKACSGSIFTVADASRIAVRFVLLGSGSMNISAQEAATRWQAIEKL